MRITRDTLLKIARDTVDSRTRQDRTVMAVYLSGSLLENDFQLGGTADIDLVFIHTDHEGQEREIVHLTDDVHLDIAHHLYKDYRQTRKLRIHPWLGPVLNNATVMYDPQHFLDFTQASVRGQFDRADYVLSRVRNQLEQSRQIWFRLQAEETESDLDAIWSYQKAVTLVANSIASVSSSPLTERRFLLQFPEKASELGRPGLYPGILGLLGAPYLMNEMIPEWLSSWQAAYEEIPETKRPVRLHSSRIRYYKNAFDAILETEQPEAILYPLLNTWTQAILCIQGATERQNQYRSVLTQLGLMGDGFTERIQALDAYLDAVEETIEEWAKANGVWME